MSVFWGIAAALGLAVIAMLALPVIRRSTVAANRAEYDINVYKDQLAELEREAEEGRIGERELDAARLEIQRRLLAADADEAKAAREDKKSDRIPVVAAAIAVPVLAAVVYVELGSPGTPGFPLAERDPNQMTAAAGAATPHQGRNAAPMSDAIQTLRAKLAENPDDVDGWILLARSYAGIGDLGEAANAYKRALPLTDRHPMLLADWAETAFMARQGSFTEEIFNAFAEARSKDATLPKPWFYIGLDKAMAGELQAAAQIWTDLITIHAANREFVSSVKTQIEKAANQGGFNAEEIRPTDYAVLVAKQMEVPAEVHDAAEVGPEVADAQPPGPTQEDVRAAQEMSEEDRSAFIRSMVQQLADKLEENPNDPGGWQRLIRAYEVLGETEKAAEARERLRQLQ